MLFTEKNEICSYKNRFSSNEDKVIIGGIKMIRTYKICSTILIMLILAVLIVCLVNFLQKKPKETYEGILVQQTCMEEAIL